MSRRVLALVAAGVLAVVAAIPPAGADPGQVDRAATYTNPVSPPGAAAFGSPTVIRGRDGFWYAFGPGNPLHPGGERPHFPILRSADLTSWEYVGDVFTEATFPSWGDSTQGRWAPGIEYFDGEYRLYFTLRNLPGVEERPNTAIGVATAPNPLGPWEDSGTPLVEPRKWTPPGQTERHRTIIDADVFTAPDGRRYLYYGGFGGGVWVTRLSDDGLRTVGEEHRVTTDSTYEGPYVVHRDGWYYLFVSSGHCCRGPVSGYAVWVGRSKNPTGPFVDRHGRRLDAESPGGTPVVTANGNRWVGTGHNAMLTDLAGRDFLTFNGIDRDDPYLVGDSGEIRRPMLIDRLDWIDGWPTVRAGALASDGPVRAPEVAGRVVDAFEGRERLGRQWSGTGWSLGSGPAGGFAHAGPGAADLVAREPLDGDVRVRLAVRAATSGSSAGVRLGLRGDSPPVLDARIDGRTLVVSARIEDGGTSTKRAPLPDSFDASSWHDLEVLVRGREATVRVSDAGLYDPVAEAEVSLVSGIAGRFAVTGADAEVDDVTAARLAEPVTEAVREPTPGRLDAGLSDEFADGLAPGSSWIREPAGTVEDGALAVDVQVADLTGTSNSASLLVRDVPDDTSWIAQTKVTLPFGAGPWRAFPQAGMLAYAGDDSYLRLTARANRQLRIAAFQKEIEYAGRLMANASTAGPVADTTWLRLAHDVDPDDGEHRVRAGTSTDGEHWTWGTTAILPAGSDIRIALGAHGAAGADEGVFSARFDYLRVYEYPAVAGEEGTS